MVAPRGAVDRRPRQVEELGRQPIAELRVAVLDADGIGELGPGKGVLVGPACSAEQGDALGPAPSIVVRRALARRRERSSRTSR